MPVYIVTGKLGAGKTLLMAGRMRDYVSEGRRVATNVDLNVRELVAEKPVHMPIRLPDRPTMADLEALGTCHTTCREELNGAIVLDECGTWLNSRSWGDKNRQALIDWLLHSRKRGWDVFFVVQHVNLIDKQVREAMAEYVVIVKRLDRYRIPLVGWLIRALSFGHISGNMPKVHVANAFYGMPTPGSEAAFSWRYRGSELYAAYSSAQIIEDFSAGMYSLAWYETPAEVEARRARIPKPKPLWVRRVQRLPPNRRIPALRTLGLA
jgi:hypothetical protein